MAELVYIVLMYGPKPASSIALTETLDKYRDGEVVLEVNSRDYHQLSGYSSHFISADERTRILNQTLPSRPFATSTNSCIGSWTTASKRTLTKTLQPNINGVDIEGDAIATVILDEVGEDNEENLEVYLEAHEHNNDILAAADGGRVFGQFVLPGLWRLRLL